MNITPKLTQSNCTPSRAAGTPTMSTAPQKSARQAANAKKSVLFRLRTATIGALRQHDQMAAKKASDSSESMLSEDDIEAALRQELQETEE